VGASHPAASVSRALPSLDLLKTSSRSARLVPDA